jgi:Ca2+/H+ antiporter, TMEM165/GDT1 family
MEQKSFVFRKVLVFILIAVVAIILFGTIVMWLWNNVLAVVLNIPVITFGQALGILVLSKILFGGWRGGGWGGGRHHWKNRMREKWSAMTPEEREKFKEQWQRRCGPWRTTFNQPETNPGNPIDHS